jgi:two-component system, OmpR family, sensor kinase
MIFHSIKWRLQLWYGLILVAVLAGFGVTSYQLERGRQYRHIDGELQRRANALAGALHRPPHGRGLREGLPDGQRPPPEAGALDAERSPAREFQLPPEVENLFGGADPAGFYYRFFWRVGQKYVQSTNAPDSLVLEAKAAPTEANRVETVTPPGRPAGPPRLGGMPAQQPPVNRGTLRELTVTLPSGEDILVGCSIAPELAELRLVAFKLAAVGGVILLLGLAGGATLVARALRPIDDISATAVKIAAGDLSQRIDTADAETELGRLATVLNSTFARLEATFAQQRQFTSDAAHELRTPVSVILTQAQSTLARERNPAEYRETIEACQRAAQRMRRLITSLLELARFDAGQEKLNRQRFDLAQTARECVELVGPIAAERGVTMHGELPARECVGDAERLGQVVTNLLTNAIQHNPPGTAVRVTLAAQGNLAVLTVADNGAGIAAEDLPRVFERFYQADPSRTGGGAGLGLAISKAVVEAHGGTLEVASRKGEGTTFVIRLPV